VIDHLLCKHENQRNPKKVNAEKSIYFICLDSGRSTSVISIESDRVEDSFQRNFRSTSVL
jgi:hypothetical protein